MSDSFNCKSTSSDKDSFQASSSMLVAPSSQRKCFLQPQRHLNISDALLESPVLITTHYRYGLSEDEEEEEVTEKDVLNSSFTEDINSEHQIHQAANDSVITPLRKLQLVEKKSANISNYENLTDPQFSSTGVNTIKINIQNFEARPEPGILSYDSARKINDSIKILDRKRKIQSTPLASLRSQKPTRKNLNNHFNDTDKENVVEVSTPKSHVFKTPQILQSDTKQTLCPHQNYYKENMFIGTPNDARIQQMCKPPEAMHISNNYDNHNTPHPGIVASKLKNHVVVSGREYSIESKLGQGGSSEVFEGVDVGTSQRCAIKCVNMNVDAVTAKGFLDEIEILRKLQTSDFVIKMFGCEQVGEKLYVVMEKGDVDFSTIISENKFMDMTVIISYWVQMLNAVSCIHNNGIIHSDLKPANFLMLKGQLKLIDFGIASNVQSDCTSIIKNNQAGTLNYISPEALTDVRDFSTGNSPTSTNLKINISYKSDVWSLGCILYRLLYGVTPFHHIKTKWAKMYAIIDKNHTINYPNNSNQMAIPIKLINALKGCLTYEMRKRPSVNDLLNIKYICYHDH